MTDGLRHISSTTRLLAITLGKVLTYYEGFSLVKSHNPLNPCSFKIT